MEVPHVFPGVAAEDGDADAFTNFTASLLYLADPETPDKLYADPCAADNPLFNCSVTDYLLYAMGPQRLALSVAIPITVVYVLIFVTGVVGNVSVCIVIVRHHSMHTATNYYLFSLAISDLTLLLLGLPNDISYYWHQYPYSLGIGFCKLRALLSEASSYVSVLTIVAFSMERYLAICHPLHLYTMSGLQRAVRIIASLWIVSLLCATPFMVHTTIHYINYPPNSTNITTDSAFCAMLSKPSSFPLWEISSIVFFLLPALVILVLYARMGMKIRARSRHHLGKGVKGSVHGETRQAHSRKAIIRMLAAVVIAFFVCWAPFHAQRLIYIYGAGWTYYKEINEWMFSITGSLYYVSSTVNPILYNVMSNRYRVAFRETLCCGRRAHNGFSREQSSFRETTIATSGEGNHLVRVRSITGDPLQRTNTACRMPRQSTISNQMPTHIQRKWSDGGSSKKWNSDKNQTNFKMGSYYDHNPNPNNKRKEITFGGEMNDLLKTHDCAKHHIAEDAKSDEETSEDVLVVLGRTSTNGLKKIYANNLQYQNSNNMYKIEDYPCKDQVNRDDKLVETSI